MCVGYIQGYQDGKKVDKTLKPAIWLVSDLLHCLPSEQTKDTQLEPAKNHILSKGQYIEFDLMTLIDFENFDQVFPVIQITFLKSVKSKDKIAQKVVGKAKLKINDRLIIDDFLFQTYLIILKHEESEEYRVKPLDKNLAELILGEVNKDIEANEQRVKIDNRNNVIKNGATVNPYQKTFLNTALPTEGAVPYSTQVTNFNNDFRNSRIDKSMRKKITTLAIERKGLGFSTSTKFEITSLCGFNMIAVTKLAGKINKKVRKEEICTGFEVSDDDQIAPTFGKIDKVADSYLKNL